MYRRNVLVQYHCTGNFLQQSNSRRNTTNDGMLDVPKNPYERKEQRETLTLSVSLSLCPSRNAIFTVELYK